MNYKRWLIAGGAVFLLSVIFGTVGMMWWMYSVVSETQPKRATYPDGSMDMPGAVYAALFMFIGIAAGSVLMTIGGVKAYRFNRAKSSDTGANKE